MKNLTTILLLLFSLTIFCQENEVKMYQASKVVKTSSNGEAQSSSKAMTNTSSKAAGGTVNGSTKDNLSVSLSGGVNYDVPIDVPPGLNGVQPEIALSFDGHSGNGLAGWGWNVSGISVITRIPSTLFHDGLIDAVDFDSYDRFALDGQRLIVKSGNYGAAGSEYQTEQYSNLKIVAYQTHPTSGVQGPKYFKVFYPDGSFGVYGYNNDSRSRTDYAISYWENPQGIRISYSYNIDDNALSIDKISYGSRGTSTPINEIEFVYEPRDAREQSFVGGVSFMRKERLKRIDVKGNQSDYRKYFLTYQNGVYDRLQEIREHSYVNGGSGRDPIQFNYGATAFYQQLISGEASTLNVTDLEQRNAKALPLDFSGDGKMDFVIYPTHGPDTKKKFWFFTDLQNENGFYHSNSVDTGSFVDIFPVNWMNHQHKVMPSQGLAVVQNSGSNQVRFEVWAKGDPATGSPISNSYTKTWNAPTYTGQSYCGGNTYQVRISQKYLSGDFNGDGLSDIVAISFPYTYTNCVETPIIPGQNCDGGDTPQAKNSGVTGNPKNQSSSPINSSTATCCECNDYDVTTSQVHLIQLDRRKTTGFASSVGALSSDFEYSDKFLTMDVNGDGKTDILKFKDGKVEAYSMNLHNTHMMLLWIAYDNTIDLDFPILPGDYNGDGKADFMIPTANNSTSFKMFLSTGTGVDPRTHTLPFQFKFTDYDASGQGTLYGYNLVPVDIDGDNKTDIIDYKTTTSNNSTNGTQSITVFLNRSNNSSNNSHQFKFDQAGPTRDYTGYLKHFPIPIFLTSDQKNNNLDFATISDKWVSSFSFNKDLREDVTLRSIENNGVTTHIKYDQVNEHYSDLSNDPSFFKSYTTSDSHLSQNYPFININIAPSFKVVRELEQNGSGIYRKQRYYYEGAVSHAKGLGFMGFEVMMQSNWYGDGVPSLWTVSQYDPVLRGAIKEQTISNNYSTNPSTYLSKTNYYYDYKLIANPSSPSAPEYEENINRSSSLPGAETDEAEVSITLLPGFHAIGSNGDYHALIVPPSEQPGEEGYAGAVDIRLNRKETDNGLTGVLTTETYSYDDYNNPTITNTSFPGGSRTVTYQYSNNVSATNNTYHVGRIKNMTESVTLNGNSFSTEEQYTYNNNLITQIKRKGNGTGWLTETFGYDINGNIISKTLTDGNEITRSESYDYDGYGGRFLTQSVDVEGMVTVFSYEDLTGNLTSTTEYYGLTANPLTTAFEHDAWGRIIKETDYLSNDINHVYTDQPGGKLFYSVEYPDGGKEETRYNAFGWVTKTGTLSLNNQWVYVDYEYYVDGKIKRQSEPSYASSGQWNTYYYDVYGRPTSQTLYTGRNISYTYSGLSTTVNDGVKSVTTTLDALGNTIKVQDPGGTIDYTYHANGTIKTADYGGNLVTVGIDGWGRKTSLNDPSAGAYSYSYNDLGELLTETTPKGTTTYDYDKPTGRVLSKTMTGDLTDMLLTYSYNRPTKQLTNINGVDNTNGGRVYNYDYTYDDYERLDKINEDTGQASFEYDITYDPQLGRVQKEKMTSTLNGGASKILTTNNVYDAAGILIEIWNDGTPDKLWELNEVNARGQALKITLDNGIEKTKTYDAYGYLTKIEDKETGTNPTVALHMEYDFHQQRGTLNSRENFGFNWQETFTHDNLDRLTAISGDVSHTKTYMGNGNIDINSALGTYEYGDNSKKYQLTEIDPNTAGEAYFIQHPTQQITYNAFKKPIDIHQAGHGRVSFEYGALMNRSTAYYGGEDEDKALRRYTKHYSAIIPVEIVEDMQAGTSKIITYVGGDAYTAPMAHIKISGAGATLDEYHYLHRDYLGSILAITDASGNVKEERQFGAWGAVDQFLDSGGGTTFGHSALLGRGYTGHEHFFEVGLIHMNGRMYDPQLGRFLSPDNFVQEPFNTQSYNRYGYVLNSPLMYTDPSGELFGGGAGETWLAVTLVALFVGTPAVLVAIGSFDGGAAYAPTPYNDVAPSPSNNPSNASNTSSISRQSRGGPNWWSRITDTWNKVNRAATEFVAGTQIGHKMFLDNTISGITKGLPQLMGQSLIANGRIINGDFKGGFDFYRDTGSAMVEGIVEPFVQAYDGVGDLAQGDFIGAGINLSQASDAAALALISDGIGTGGVAVSRGLSGLAKIRNGVLKGGKSFNRYKKAHGGGGLVGEIDLIAPHKYYGNKFPVRTEFSHRFITQRAQRKHNLPNWMVNNKLNVYRTNTLKHSSHDVHRYRFLPREIKRRLGPGGDLDFNMFK